MQYTRQSDQPDKRTEALRRLEAAVAAIQDSESFRQYLDMQARFHRYSFGNVLMIHAQRPGATFVAGYATWQQLGRQVRKGEKAIRIIVPMRRKVEGEDEAGDGRLFFGTGAVFDVSQTEGDALPSVECPVLDGNEGAELYDRLLALASTEGLTVEIADSLDGEMMGYYQPQQRRIVVRRAAMRQMVKTAAHELAHHLGGHRDSNADSETTAEAVAYVVLSHFGIDSGERSFPYVATWSRDSTVLKEALGSIQRLSAKIIDALTPAAIQALEAA